MVYSLKMDNGVTRFASKGGRVRILLMDWTEQITAVLERELMLTLGNQYSDPTYINSIIDNFKSSVPMRLPFVVAMRA